MKPKSVAQESKPLKQEGRANTKTEAFKNWFGDSKVVDENGNPKIVYSGHSNIELYGNKFNEKKATAGGFYATENPQIASNYAVGKIGVKEHYEHGLEYRLGDKLNKKIWQIELNDEQQQKAYEFILNETGQDFKRYVEENKIYDTNVKRWSYQGLRSLQNIYDFMESMGDTISYWNDNVRGKSNFDDLLDVLKIKNSNYYDSRGGVFPVYLSIQNPIDTSKDFPVDLMKALEIKAKREKILSDSEVRELVWTKDYPLRNWIAEIKKMQETEEETFWATHIPAKALPIIKEYGYDGVKDVGGKMGGEEHAVWVAFNGTQVKSINNKGTWSQQDSNMLNQETKGSFQNIDGINIIKIFEGADESTLVHEFAHMFLRRYIDVAPELIEPVKKWAGVKDITNEAEYRKLQEKFARGFEAYLREGKAPTTELQTVFDKFREWLLELYKNIKDLNIVINDDMRKFFDDMLTGQQTQLGTKEQSDIELAQQIEAEKNRQKEYLENLSIDSQSNDFKEQLIEGTKDTYRSGAEWADTSFVPLTSRLGSISIKLKQALRRFDFNSLGNNTKINNRVKPFLEKYSKLEVVDARTLDYALKRRDINKILEIVEENNMLKDYEEVKNVLQELYDGAEQVQLDMGFLDNYFPTRVKDPYKFMSFIKGTENWSKIEAELKIMDPDNEMTDVEQAQAIGTMLRGFGGDKALLARPSYTKERQIIDLTPQMNAYYNDSSKTLIDYIRAMTEIIEARKLFGKSEKDINQSIGMVVNDMIKSGDIEFKDEQKAKEILIARFNSKGTSKIWSLYKDFTYLTLLGSPISAITQIEDIGITLYRAGFFNTTKGLISSIAGTSDIKLEDLGLVEIAEEFADETIAKKTIKKIFKLTGFKFMDRLGKESFINAVYLKYKQQAENTSDRFMEMLDNIFGDESSQVLADLKGNEISENIKYLMFNELAEIQPITMSEMPESYVTGGNIRLLYTLKSFTLKR
jgi:hypothetical protein